MTLPGSNRPVPVPTHLTGPFWEAARERRLVMQFDPATGRFQFYPRPGSMATGRRNLEWRNVSGKGHVYSYTVTHVAPAGFQDIAPYTIACVDLDEGVRMIGRLVNIAPEQTTIGLRVQICWEALSGEAIYFAFEPEQ